MVKRFVAWFRDVSQFDAEQALRELPAFVLHCPDIRTGAESQFIFPHEFAIVPFQKPDPEVSVRFFNWVLPLAVHHSATMPFHDYYEVLDILNSVEPLPPTQDDDTDSQATEMEPEPDVISM